MEEETIITHTRVPDKVIIEDQYEYAVYTTLGLTKLGDYYVKLEFINLDLAGITEVAALFKLSKALKFHSELVKRVEYNITHIVVERLNSGNDYSMLWECLSDDPDYSLIIE